MAEEITILPESGYILLKDLAEFVGKGNESVKAYLLKFKPNSIIRVSNAYLVDLSQLKRVSKVEA